jgi:hypothetical protein
MKISEYNEMMAYMLRPATRQKFAIGGGVIEGQDLGSREGFAIPSREELKIIADELAEELGRLPTQTEVAKKAKIAIATVRNRLQLGIDFAKPLTKLEAGKLGGKKPTGITEVSDDLVKQFKDLKFTHISPGIETTKAGSKMFRVTISGPIANDFKIKARPATEENLQTIANEIDDVVTSNVYKNKAKQFKTPEQFRKLRRLKDAMYKKKDPYGVYEKLRKYKSKIFPGDFSKEIQIQHGQPKFSTQTLSRFGFIPKDVNVSPEVEMVERIRNEKLATIQQKLKSTTLSIGQKADLIEEFNDTMKGLRGQLKGTPAQGLVNFELLDIDQDGNVTKLKDTGFDPKKGLVASDEDLSKITKERADELIKLGKQKINSEAVRLNLIPADKISTPEKTKTREMFEQANKRLSDGPTLGMNLGLGKALGSVLKYVPTPAATVGLSAGFGIDPESSLDRTILGTELAAAPALVKQSSRIASNPLLRRALNLGLSPQMAMRAARVASPIGIASLIGEAGYNLGKQALSEQDRIDAMSPEEREEFLAEQESLLDFSA